MNKSTMDAADADGQGKAEDVNARGRRKSVTVPLEYPIEVDGREISSLTFRRMKAKDALAGEGEPSEVRAGYCMYAALAGVDVAVIEELDLADLETIAEEVAPLMGKRGAQTLTDLKGQENVSSGAT